MKKIAVFFVLLVSIFLVSCAEEDVLSVSGGEGLVDSKAERRRRVETIMDYNERMLQDDWDGVWFFDTNSKLSYWYVDVGN